LTLNGGSVSTCEYLEHFAGGFCVFEYVAHFGGSVSTCENLEQFGGGVFVFEYVAHFGGSVFTCVWNTLVAVSSILSFLNHFYQIYCICGSGFSYPFIRLVRMS
jgi:hypothetical protein